MERSNHKVHFSHSLGVFKRVTQSWTETGVCPAVEPHMFNDLTFTNSIHLVINNLTTQLLWKSICTIHRTVDLNNWWHVLWRPALSYRSATLKVPVQTVCLTQSLAYNVLQVALLLLLVLGNCSLCGQSWQWVPPLPPLHSIFHHSVTS